MFNKIVYVLKMFSSCLVSEPVIRIDGMDLFFELKGYDDNNKYHECCIKFVSVIGYEYLLAGFDIIKDSYDTIIEIVDSEWIEKIENKNNGKYIYWKPKHYALYLDEVGQYQFLAQNVIVEEK